MQKEGAAMEKEEIATQEVAITSARADDADEIAHRPMGATVEDR